MSYKCKVSSCNRAFGVVVQSYKSTMTDKFVYAPNTMVTLPGDLSDVVAVYGLTNVPMFRHTATRALKHALEQSKKRDVNYNGASPQSSQVFAKAYNFPPGFGAGQCIALVEYGGGYDQSDLDTYWATYLPNGPTPVVTWVNTTATALNYGSNASDGAGGEVVLDIQVIGVVAPLAKIVVVFTPNAGGPLPPFNRIISDTTMCGTGRTADFISVSWGFSLGNGSNIVASENAYKAATIAGIGTFISTGDNGANNKIIGQQKISYGAASLYVTGVGGTSLLVGPNGNIQFEGTWNSQDGGGTGGGIAYNLIFNGSQPILPRPSYQNGITYLGQEIPFRGIPDVSGVADPGTSYSVYFLGKFIGVGGTSASAPLWAALAAIMQENIQAMYPNSSRLGFFNPIIYALPRGLGFNDVKSGNNIMYPDELGFYATPGWDPVTGFGTPIGTVLLNAILAYFNHTSTVPVCPTFVAPVPFCLSPVCTDNVTGAFTTNNSCPASGVCNTVLAGCNFIAPKMVVPLPLTSGSLADWSTVISASSTSVSFIIANVNNGPGTGADPNLNATVVQVC